jgi:hypothetical protein
MAAADAAITEVPSVERLRLHGQSNLRAVRDGCRVLRTILTEWLRKASKRQDRLPSAAVPHPALRDAV